MPTRQFSYVLLDVFASRPLEGNQLAVFPDARAMSEREMQAVAREMNLSETTFILPGDSVKDSADGVRVRIFTIEEEMPFAGHPTLGTANVVRSLSKRDEVRLRLNVGTIPIAFRDDDEGVFGEMRQRDPEFGSLHDRETVARVVGMPAEAISADVPIQTVSTGIPFTMVLLRDLQTLQNLRFHWSASAEYLERTQGGFFYFLSRETVDPAARLHARMIFYGGEDPATGSAAGCCISWAVAHGLFASGEQVAIEQGLECKRPSKIFVRGELKGDRIINVRVGGYAVIVGRGELFL